jgi:hypothetical protein
MTDERCGATVRGDDRVRGVCQARYGYREPLRLILIDKRQIKDNGQTKIKRRTRYLTVAPHLTKAKPAFAR